MTIDRLNPVDPIRDPKKASQAGRANGAGRGDSISLSSEAVQKAELFQAMELAKAAPDMRMDRIAQLKAAIQDPSYMDDAVISMTADRIIDQLME